MSASWVVAALLSLAPVSTASDVDADTAAFAGERNGATVYNFDDDNIEGEVLRPDGANVSGRQGLRHQSLLTIRPHFIQELHQLAMDI